jgi:hypothetical protein
MDRYGMAGDSRRHVCRRWTNGNGQNEILHITAMLAFAVRRVQTHTVESGYHMLFLLEILTPCVPMKRKKWSGFSVCSALFERRRC